MPSSRQGDLGYFREVAARALQTQSDWTNINLALPSGQQIMNLAVPEGESLPNIGHLDGSFERLLKTRGPVVSDLAVGPALKRWRFAVRAPVLGDGGEVKYVLSAGVNPDALARIVKAQDLPPGWVGVVLDRNDRIVARTRAPEESFARLASPSLREGLARSQSGWFRGSTLEGEEVYTPYRRSAVTGWAFAMGIPAAAVEAAAARTFWALGLGVLGALVLAIAAAYFISRRIALPMGALASATDAMGRGEPIDAPGTVRIAELRKLADAMRASAQAIHERQALIGREQAALRASEERLRLALDAGRMGNWEWNVRTSEVVWSTELEALHGLAPGSFAGTFDAYEKDIHPDDRQAVRLAIAGTLQTGSDHHVEYRIVRPDGEVRWVEGRGRVYRDESGAPLRVVGVCTDVTERKRAEERFRLALEASPSAKLMADGAGRIVLVNAQTERLFGYAREELIGQPVELLVPERFRSHHPEHRAAFAAAPRARPMGAGRELYGLRKDGAEVPIEIGLNPLQIEGEPFVLSAITDVTERKRSEAKLQREREQLALALNAGQMGAYDLDLVANALWWSPETYALFGVAPRDFNPSRESFTALLHPDDRERFWSQLDGAIARREPFTHEFRVVRPDGIVRWVANRAQTEYDPGGRAVRHFGVALDITERKRTEQALRDADRHKDEFLATLSHELRNPLAALTSSAHVLKVAGPGSLPAIESRAVIERQTMQLTRLVDDLLDLSSITVGKMSLRRESFDLGDLAEKVLGAWRETGRLERLRVALDAAQVWVEADRARMEQVLSNLLDNAVKFTAPGKGVRVSARAEGDHAVLEVSDEGQGIDASELGRIFELFVQGDPDPGRSKGGMGIGLALAKRLVEMHGGTISAASKGIGRGATFAVRLPLAARPEVASAPGRARPGRGGRRVLIIEDNDDARETLQRALELNGHQVRAARDGSSGIAAAGEQRPDVALIDIALPDFDGYEVARRLRARDADRRIRLIAITGYGQESDRRRALEAGFDVHLTKPVSYERLKQIIGGLT
jgi:PAS domain S-box-containing protein